MLSFSLFRIRLTFFHTKSFKKGMLRYTAPLFDLTYSLFKWKREFSERLESLTPESVCTDCVSPCPPASGCGLGPARAAEGVGSRAALRPPERRPRVRVGGQDSLLWVTEAWQCWPGTAGSIQLVGGFYEELSDEADEAFILFFPHFPHLPSGGNTAFPVLFKRQLQSLVYFLGHPRKEFFSLCPSLNY